MRPCRRSRDAKPPAILRAANAAARQGGMAERVKGVWGDVPPSPTVRSPRGKRRRIRRLAARPAAPPGRGARERAKTGLAVSRDGRAARGRAAAGRRAKPVLRLSRPRARHAVRRVETRTQRLRGAKRPACPALSRAGCRPMQGRSARPLSCGRAPRSGRVESGCGSESPKGRPGDRPTWGNSTQPRFSGRYPAAVRGVGGSPSGAARLRCHSPAAILRRRHRREGAAPFLRPLSCGRGGGDRVCGLF